MNKIKHLNEWKKYFFENKFYKKLLNDITDIENDKVFFNPFLIQDNKIKANIGIGYNNFNPISIKLLADAFAIFLVNNATKKEKEKIKILVAHDGTDELKEFCEILSNVLLLHGLRIYLFEYNKAQPLSLIQYSIKNIEISLCFYFSKSDNEYLHYLIQVLNYKGEFLDNNILFSIIKNIEAENAFNISDIKLKPSYLLNKKIENEYIEKLLKLQVNSNSDKKLKILIANSSKCSYELMQEISGLMNIEYVLSKNISFPNNEFFAKDLDFNKLKYFSKFINQAKKNNLDVIFIPSFNGNQLDVIIKNNKEYWILNYEQIAIMILEYIFNNKDENFNPKEYYIATTINFSEIINRIASKYGVAIFEDINYFNNISKYKKKLLFYFDENKRFLIDKNISNSSDIFQIQVLLLEIFNYYKLQNRDLNFVLNNFINKYSKKVIFNKKIFINRKSLEYSLKYLSDKKNFNKNKIKYIEYLNNNQNFSEKKYLQKIILEEDSKIFFIHYFNSNLCELIILTENDDLKKRFKIRKNKSEVLFKNIKKELQS